MGEIVKICFVMELAGLKGRERLKDYNVDALITYPGNQYDLNYSASNIFNELLRVLLAELKILEMLVEVSHGSYRK